ncbi:MAG TPA: acyl-CoA dehydrogenase family protein [Acidimicrobiia bacterium]|nr:acyl-CoA dehydrogenase family protein [Acidimicrobiia bacterium]
MRRTLYDEDHELFRRSVRAFVETEIVPHYATWETNGVVDRTLFHAAARAGLTGMSIPPEYGGGGVTDFRYNAVMAEEYARAGVGPAGAAIGLQTDIIIPYFLAADEQQKARWLPGIAAGDVVTAIAMTEPGTGSDLASISTTAIRDGDSYLVNGQKTFISNGQNADLVIVAAKTDPTQTHAGMSLIVVEGSRSGFARGRNLDKVGMHAQDTSELFFDDVRVPASNLLGAEGTGFFQLVEKMPQERLSIAVGAMAAAEAAFSWTLAYAKERQAFGRPIGRFQHNRFVLAEMKTDLDLGWAFVDRQIQALNDGALTAEDAAEAKWWCTEMQVRLIDRAVQMHGGYGYMREYPIARAWMDGRVQTIYGGTTEIMKEIIGRGLGV